MTVEHIYKVGTLLFDNLQDAETFDEYSKSSRNIFTKQEYKKLAETLSKHVEGKITLKASELTSIATDYAIKQTRKIANINKP